VSNVTAFIYKPCTFPFLLLLSQIRPTFQPQQDDANFLQATMFLLHFNIFWIEYMIQDFYERPNINLHI